MDKYEVIGQRTVGGVEPGGVVELDPARVNIEALIRGGHVRPVRKAEAKTEAKAKPAGKSDAAAAAGEAGEV